MGNQTGEASVSGCSPRKYHVACRDLGEGLPRGGNGLGILKRWHKVQCDQTFKHSLFQQVFIEHPNHVPEIVASMWEALVNRRD